MSRAAEPMQPEASPAGPTPKRLCPFCGTVNERDAVACVRCAMEDTPATRQATRARIGPWHVLQARNPAAPGMKFSTLISLVRKNQISQRSIVRGPTTQQLWTLAANVKGLSREFGLCYACGEDIDSTVNICPHCQKMQEPPINPDVLLEGQAASAAEAPAPAATSQRRQQARPYTPEPSVNVDLDEPFLSSSSASSIPSPPAQRQQQQQLPVRMSSHPPAGHPNPGILTAKELATAFQLEFQPQPKPAPKKPRRRRVGRAVMVLLLLGAVGAGAVAYVRPDLRDRAVEWARTTTEQLKARLEKSPDDFPASPPRRTGPIFSNNGKPTSGSAAGGDIRNDVVGGGADSASPASSPNSSTAKVDPMFARPTPPPDADPQPKAELPPPTPNPTPVVTNEQNAERASDAQTPTTVPAAVEPTVEPPIVKVPEIKPETKPEAKPEPEAKPNVEAKPAGPAPKPEPVVDDVEESEAEVEPEPEPTPQSEEETRNKVRLLRRAAIDAEVAHDYEKAVRLYEQIKKFPRDKWPLDLEVRLDNARKQLE